MVLLKTKFTHCIVCDNEVIDAFYARDDDHAAKVTRAYIRLWRAEKSKFRLTRWPRKEVK